MYQPIFELSPYRLVGFEALARWTHPQRGAISPAVFIALAEESGHINPWTSWVIEQATAQLSRFGVPAIGQHPDHARQPVGRDLGQSATGRMCNRARPGMTCRPIC